MDMTEFEPDGPKSWPQSVVGRSSIVLSQGEFHKVWCGLQRASSLYWSHCDVGDETFSCLKTFRKVRHRTSVRGWDKHRDRTELRLLPEGLCSIVWCSWIRHRTAGPSRSHIWSAMEAWACSVRWLHRQATNGLIGLQTDGSQIANDCN